MPRPTLSEKDWQIIINALTLTNEGYEDFLGMPDQGRDFLMAVQHIHQYLFLKGYTGEGITSLEKIIKEVQNELDHPTNLVEEIKKLNKGREASVR